MQISEIILYVILFIILVVVSLVIAKLYNGGKESFAVGGGRRLKKIRKLKKRKRYHGGAAFAKNAGANNTVDAAVKTINANAVNYTNAGHKQTGDELVAYANQLQVFSNAWVPIDDDPNNAGGPAGPMHTANNLIDTNVGAILTAIADLDRLNTQAAITQQESQDYAAAVTIITNASTTIKSQTLDIKDHIDDLITNAAVPLKQQELAGIMTVNGGLTAQQVQQLTGANTKQQQLTKDKQQIGQQKQTVDNAKQGLNKTLVAANQLVIDKRKASDEASAKKAAATSKKITKATSDAATANAVTQQAVTAADAAQKTVDANDAESQRLKGLLDQNKTDIDTVTVLLGQLNALPVVTPAGLFAKCQAADTAADNLVTATNLTVLAVQVAPQPVAPQPVPVAVPPQVNPVPVAPVVLVAPAPVVTGVANEANLLYLSSFIKDLPSLTQLVNDILPDAATKPKTVYDQNLLGDPTNTVDTKYDLTNDNFKHSQEVIESVKLTITTYFKFLKKTKDLYNQGLLTHQTTEKIFALTVTVKDIIKTHYVFAPPNTPPKLSGIVLFNQARINDIDTIFNTIKNKAIPLLNNEITTQAALPGAPGGGVLFHFTDDEFDAAYKELTENSVTPWYPLTAGGQTDYYKVISHDRLTANARNTSRLNGKLITDTDSFINNGSNAYFDNNDVAISIILALQKYQALKTIAPINNNLKNVLEQDLASYVTLLMYIDYIGMFLDYILSLYSDPTVHTAVNVQTISMVLSKLFRQTKLSIADITEQDKFQQNFYGKHGYPNPALIVYNPALKYKDINDILREPVFKTAYQQFITDIKGIAYVFREILPPSIEPIAPLVRVPAQTFISIASKLPVDSTTSIYKLDAIMVATLNAYEIWRYGIAAVECGARANKTLLTQTDVLRNEFLAKYVIYNQSMADGSIANSNTFTTLKDALLDAFKQFRWKLLSKRAFVSDDDGPNTNEEQMLYNNIKLRKESYLDNSVPQKKVEIDNTVEYNAYYDQIQKYLLVNDGRNQIRVLTADLNGVLAVPYANTLRDGVAFDFPFIANHNPLAAPVNPVNLTANELLAKRQYRYVVRNPLPSLDWPTDNSATFRRIYELLVYNGSKIDTEPISQDHPPSLMTLFIQTLNSPELNIPQQINKQLNIQATSYGPGAVGSTQPLIEPPPATVETPQFKTYTTQPTSSVSFTSLSEGSMLTVGDLKQTAGNVVVVADNIDDLNKKIQRIVDENAGSRNLYGLVVDTTGETTPLLKSVAIELGMKPPADIEKLTGDKRKSSRGWLYEIKEYPNGEFYLSIIAYIKPMEYQV